TSCGRPSARMRCDWAASSPSSPPASPRCTGSSPSWSSRPRACAPASARGGSRCCCSTKTPAAGTPRCSATARGAPTPAHLAPAPVFWLNGPMPLSRAFGPQAGLDLVDELADEPTLRAYHLLPSVRGELLARLGRAPEGRAGLGRAALRRRN